MGLEYCILYNMILLHHSSSIPLIHQHMGPQEIRFLSTLVGLNGGKQLVVKSSSNVIMGGAVLDSLLAADVPAGAAFSELICVNVFY